VDLGELDADFWADPHPYYAKWRETGPVLALNSPFRGRLWLVVGYDEARSALADARLAKSPHALARARNIAPPEDDTFMGRHLLIADPPDHTRLRRLIAREFTARRVRDMAPRIQEITDGLLDAMVPAGRGDLVDSLAFPLPITVICELLGVPETDRASFRKWSNDLVAPPGPEEIEESSRAMRAYLDDLVAGKRADDDDLLAALVRTRDEEGDRLSGPELRGMAFVLLVAGHETTVNLIGNAVRVLLRHPDQLAALRADMSLIDAAVEEVLRFEGPVENATVRFTTQPVDIGGTVIPPGETVLVGLASADRDPARFPDADAFDIARYAGGGPSHLAFGHGIHFCVGAPLARLEAAVAVRSLLERCPRLALDPDADPWEFVPGLLIRGTRHLPLRW
jgi:cytochrome P450